MNGDSSFLWCPAGISARSPSFFSLHQTVGGTHSKVLHQLLLFLPMNPSFTHAYRQNVRLPWERKEMLSLVVMRLRDGWWKTNWSLMSWKLRYFSADRLSVGKVSCWQPFGWRSIHSILQCYENPWSNFGRCSFFWSTCLSRCQVLLLPCQIFEQSPFIPHSQSRKQYNCLTNSQWAW